MPLRSFRRQYEHLLQSERERIIGMMEAVWSSRRVARQLGRSDCVVRKYWDQWIRNSGSQLHETRLRKPSTDQSLRT
ncbi:hypothetical protein TNCV_3198381 [Trichonephila clavipes]|nr:hypothetical protein TNCV_3198381 [Trichonephila clavipes]